MLPDETGRVAEDLEPRLAPQFFSVCRVTRVAQEEPVEGLVELFVNLVPVPGIRVATSEVCGNSGPGGSYDKSKRGLAMLLFSKSRRIPGSA